MFHCMLGGCQARTGSQENSSSADEALPEKCRQKNLDSMQPPSEEGNPCPSINAIHYCLSLRGRRLSPHKKASKIQVLRSNSRHSRCLDLHDRGKGGFSALSLSYRKSPKKSCSQNKDTDGGVAWMTLDGLLVNVDNAISSEMGKILGHQETVAWNGFAPLQKVLLVAITAAAASAAKQRHMKEMRRLQLAIDKRDKDSEILREKISQLQEHLSFWKEQAQNFCKEARDERVSPLFKLGLESTPKCESVMLEQFATPQIEQGLVKIACFRRNLRAASFKKYRDQGACFFMSAAEENNEERTFLDRLSESPSLIDQGQLTPQMPLTQLNKIFTPSNNVSPNQVGRLSQYCQKGCRRVDVSKDSLTSRVASTELVLQPKEQLSESQIMVNENCRQIDKKDERLSKESDQSLTTSDFHCTKNKEGDKTNVDSVIQVAVRNTVDNLLAPLSGRHRFVNHTCSSDMVIEQLLEELENAAAKEQLSESQIMVNKNCRQIDKKDERLSKESDQSLTTSDFHCTKNKEGDKTNVDSVIQVAVRNTVDNLLAPLSGRHRFVNHTCSSDMVIEQLLEELENAAAKVASMEAEIKSLRDSEILCERKKEEAERHLAEVRLHLDMISQRRVLQSDDSTFQDFTQSEQSGFHTCKELETTLELLRDTEQRLASCREACKKKDKAISRLEDEVASLQVMVSELRSLQATPKVVGQQDPSPVQTFLTSNLLFNLDSPVKADSPSSTKSSFSSWKGLDELSRVSDSLERESMRGSCDSETYGLECVRAWQTDGNKEEPECKTSVLQVERATTIKHAMIREESRRNRSNEEARRSSSSTDEPVRKSRSSTDEPIRKSSSSSSTDESSSGPVRHGRLPQLPKSYTSHARKLKFSNAADLRFPEDNGRRMPSPVEGGRRMPSPAEGGRSDDGSFSNKASNVLAGVEPNTPMRDRKSNSGGKDKILSHHSLDSLSKAKENFAHRRRWM